MRLGKIHFIVAEFGRGQKLLEDLQHVVRVFLEAAEGDRAAILADLALDRRRHVLKLFVDLIARLGFGAARTQHFAGDLRYSVFIHRVEKIARADKRGARHQRQLVILQQKNLDAVRESKLHRLRHLKRRQRRILQIFIRRQVHGAAVDFGLRECQ